MNTLNANLKSTHIKKQKKKKWQTGFIKKINE